MRGVAAVIGVLAALAPAGVAAAATVHAHVGATTVTLGNGLVERTWSRAPFGTARLADLRGHDRVWSAGSRDFSLSIGAAELGSDSFRADSVAVDKLDRGGLRVTFTLHPLAASAL